MPNDIVARLVADTAKAQKDVSGFFRKIQNDGTSASKSINNSFKSIRVSYIAMAGVFAGVATGLKKARDAASNLEEVNNKFNVVFRGVEDQATTMSNTLVESYAMSTREARQFLASLQDTFVPMGFAREEAAKLSGNLTKLAADVGSFNNKATADVLRDFQSALVGNTETVRKYGIVISQAGIEQEALNKGYIQSKNELTPLIKSQVIYEQILAGSKDAVGDLARSSDSYANVEKRVTAQVEDLTAKLGGALLPTIADALSFFGKIVGWLNEVDTGLLSTISIFGALSTAIVVGIKTMGLSFNSWFGWIGLIVTAATTIYTAWSQNLFGVQEILKKGAEYFMAFAQEAWVHIQTLWEKAKIVFEGFKKIISAAFTLDFDGIEQAATDMQVKLVETSIVSADKIKNIWNEAEGNIDAIKQEYAIKDTERKQQAVEETVEATEAQTQKVKDELLEQHEAYVESLDKKVEAWQENQEGKLEIELEQEERRLDLLYDLEQISTADYKAELDARAAYAKEMYGKDSLEYLQALQKKQQFQKQFGAKQVQSSLSFFNEQMSGLAKESRAAHSIQKGIAIAQTTIDTYAGAQAAFKSMAGIPVIGPGLAFAAAAAAIAAGIARVSSIKAQRFAKGGLVDRPTLGLIGEAGEAELIAPKSDFISVANDLINREAVQSVTNVNNTTNNQQIDTEKLGLIISDTVSDTLSRLRIEQRIQASELATVVEIGQRENEQLEY